MRVFGYIQKQCNEEGLVELSEVTFQTARKVAPSRVVSYERSSRKAQGEKFGHRHLQDEVAGWGENEPELPDVIVAF